MTLNFWRQYSTTVAELTRVLVTQTFRSTTPIERPRTRKDRSNPRQWNAPDQPGDGLKFCFRNSTVTRTLLGK